MEVMFSEGVQHSPRFCLDHANCINVAAFYFYLQLWKWRKLWRVGKYSHVVFGKKNPWRKRKYETMRRLDATASYFVAKFGAKSSQIFTQSSKLYA
jgi:hypothetical protein